jgi:hypothetical protein
MTTMTRYKNPTNNIARLKVDESSCTMSEQDIVLDSEAEDYNDCWDALVSSNGNLNGQETAYKGKEEDLEVTPAAMGNVHNGAYTNELMGIMGKSHTIGAIGELNRNWPVEHETMQKSKSLDELPTSSAVMQIVNLALMSSNAPIASDTPANVPLEEIDALVELKGLGKDFENDNSSNKTTNGPLFTLSDNTATVMHPPLQREYLKSEQDEVETLFMSSSPPDVGSLSTSQSSSKCPVEDVIRLPISPKPSPIKPCGYRVGLSKRHKVEHLHNYLK